MPRRICKGLILIAIFFCSPSSGQADSVYLTNGRKMECLVKTQSKDSVEFEVEIGTIRLRNSEISRIERFTPAENAEMAIQWQAHKAKADISQGMAGSAGAGAPAPGIASETCRYKG